MKKDFQKRREGNSFGVNIPWTESRAKKYYEINKKLRAKGYESLHAQARQALEMILKDAEEFLEGEAS